MSKQSPTTTDAGCPVTSDEYSLTVGPGGPNLLQDAYLIEKLAHFVRERIPDRVYHVKGGGAFGYFEVTADVTEWTKAAFLNKLPNAPDANDSVGWELDRTVGINGE
jgi:catalase